MRNYVRSSVSFHCRYPLSSRMTLGSAVDAACHSLTVNITPYRPCTAAPQVYQLKRADLPPKNLPYRDALNPPPVTAVVPHGHHQFMRALALLAQNAAPNPPSKTNRQRAHDTSNGQPHPHPYRRTGSPSTLPFALVPLTNKTPSAPSASVGPIRTPGSAAKTNSATRRPGVRHALQAPATC
jgi:hypothetical protein